MNILSSQLIMSVESVWWWAGNACACITIHRITVCGMTCSQNPSKAHLWCKPFPDCAAWTVNTVHANKQKTLADNKQKGLKVLLDDNFMHEQRSELVSSLNQIWQVTWCWWLDQLHWAQVWLVQWVYVLWGGILLFLTWLLPPITQFSVLLCLHVIQ